jgi:hypothetical protein
VPVKVVLVSVTACVGTDASETGTAEARSCVSVRPSCVNETGTVPVIVTEPIAADPAPREITPAPGVKLVAVKLVVVTGAKMLIAAMGYPYAVTSTVY